MVVLEQGVLLWQRGCIRVKVVVFGQKWLYLGKVVVFEQSNCFKAKVVVFGQKWLYSGKWL